MNNLSTKELIIQTASRLFGDSGYDNTSIRDIAKLADVNISAVNYHFSSKAKLYSEVLNYNVLKLREHVHGLAKTGISTSDFAVEIYKHFIDQKDTFSNSMRLFLLNNLPLDETIIPQVCLEEPKGPPGTPALMEIIKTEINYQGDEDNLIWAARNILHNVIMIALVTQSSFITIMKQTVCNFSEEEKIDSIRRNVQSTLNFIRSNRSDT